MISSHAIFDSNSQKFLKNLSGEKKVAKCKFRISKSMWEQWDDSTAAERRSKSYSNCEQWTQKIYSSSEHVNEAPTSEFVLKEKRVRAGPMACTDVASTFSPSSQQTSERMKWNLNLNIFRPPVSVQCATMSEPRSVWRDVSGKILFFKPSWRHKESLPESLAFQDP